MSHFRVYDLIAGFSSSLALFFLADGTPLNRRDAEGVLPHLIASKDGLFDLGPQSWRVRTPGDQ